MIENKSLLPAERRNRILEFIEKYKSAQIKELAATIEISEATIRRDLEILSSEGLIKRTHGGAIIPSQSTSFEPLYSEKFSDSVEEKRLIGEKAASLVKDGDTLILDSGSTTYQIAKHLIHHRNLTIITHDLIIASNVEFHPSTIVMVTGGIKREGFNVLIGSHVETLLRTVKVDKSFLSADAIDINHGITNATFAEVAIKELIISAAKKVFLVADHSKFGNIALVKVCPIEEVDYIITDSGIEESSLEALKRTDINVITVPKP